MKYDRVCEIKIVGDKLKPGQAKYYIPEKLEEFKVKHKEMIEEFRKDFPNDSIMGVEMERETYKRIL